MASPAPTLNLLVIGATGRVGRNVVQYALSAGHRVTAFARSIDQHSYALEHENLTIMAGNALEEATLQKALKRQQAVVSTLGSSHDHSVLYDGIYMLREHMQAQGPKRLLTVGGAGILQETPAKMRLLSPDFPDYLQSVSLAHLQAYIHLLQSQLDWTIVAPPYMPGGQRTGRYLLRADYYPEGAQGQISAEDVADFIVRELSAHQYLQSRVGIAYPV
jgi:putative NADH-flavin reductase